MVMYVVLPTVVAGILICVASEFRGFVFSLAFFEFSMMLCFHLEITENREGLTRSLNLLEAYSMPLF